jgi:ribonuclease HII
MSSRLSSACARCRHPPCYYRADMTAGPRPAPSTCYEEALWASDHRYVAGVDEVGRGPLAGPVYAAAVILDRDRLPSCLGELRDSKELQATDRERLSGAVREEALAFAIGWSTVAEIDAWGITTANKTAMVRAINALRVRPHYVLIDGPATVTHQLDRFYPEYGFASHKGYATRDHLARIERFGASSLHRRSWIAVQRRAGMLPIEESVVDATG